MRNTVNALFRTALPRYGKRSVFFLTVMAIPVLLILLGQSALLSVEGEWAACCRIAVDGGIGADGIMWQPENFHNIIFGRVVREFSRLFPLSEWLIRIPAILAALAFLAGSMVLALEVADRKTAVFTGWLMLSSYGFLYWGRVGSGQMFAAAAVIWAAVVFYGRTRDQRLSFHIGLDFFFLFFITLIMCGITPALGMVMFLLPQWVAIFTPRKWTWRQTGILLASAVCAVMLIVMLLSVAICTRRMNFSFSENLHYILWIAQQLCRSTVRAFFSSAGINFAENLLHLPRLMLPWVVLLPAAVCSLWNKRHELLDEHKRLLWGIGLFILCTGIYPVRRWGAMLPMLGPVLIILALGLSSRFRHEIWEARVEIVVRNIFIAAASLAMALPCTWPLWNKLLGVEPPLLLMVVSAVTGILTLLVLTYGIRPGNMAEKIIKRQSPLAGTVFAGVMLAIFVNCVLFPEMNMFRTERAFWQRSSSELAQCYPQPEGVIFYKMRIPEAAIFYLESKIPFQTVASAEKLDALLKRSGGSIAVVSHTSSGVKDELRTLVANNRRRFRGSGILAAEAHPVVFVRSDRRSADDGYAFWLLEF